MAELTCGCLVIAGAWGLLADLGVTEELFMVRGVLEGVREVCKEAWEEGLLMAEEEWLVVTAVLV